MDNAMILTLILTIITSIATVIIAYTNNNQLQVTIFKERYEVFNDIMRYIKHVLDTQDRDRSYHLDFKMALEKCKFLFGASVYSHLKSYELAILYVLKYGQLESSDPNENYYQNLLKAFINGEIEKPFLKYLIFPGVKFNDNN